MEPNSVLLFSPWQIQLINHLNQEISLLKTLSITVTVLVVDTFIRLRPGGTVSVVYDGAWWVLGGVVVVYDVDWWVFGGGGVVYDGAWWVVGGVVVVYDVDWWVFGGGGVVYDGAWWVVGGVVGVYDGAWLVAGGLPASIWPKAEEAAERTCRFLS